MALYSENIDVSVNKITGATVPNPITVTIPFSATTYTYIVDPNFSHSLSGTTLTLSYIGNLPAGNHSLFMGVIGVPNTNDILWVYINLTVINPHVLKYYIENKDLDDNLYRLEILERGFTGSDTQISGRIIHDYAERKDLMDCIIASNLKIDLEADSGLTLQDLYSEDEGKFLVQLFRNSQKIFHGNLKPDGITEDFVSDKWEMSLEAIDGLSTLKNLSFVNLDQTLVIGKRRIFEIVRICLSRIGYDLPINMYLPINYSGNTNPDLPILWTTIINADRFYKEKDSIKPMDCEAVLKSCLEIFGATILQMNGEWFIFRAIDFGAPTVGFYRYVDGVAAGITTINTGVNIGSHINGFDIHHINANQMKSIKPSVQAFLVNYKYGLASDLFPNPNIVFTGSGLTADGWTIYDVGTTLRDGDSGLMVANDLSELDNRKLIESTTVVSLSEGDRISIGVRGQNGRSDDGDVDYNRSTYRYKIETANYVLIGNVVDFRWELKSAYPNGHISYSAMGTAYVDFDNIFDITMPESSSIKFTMELYKVYATIQSTFGGFRPFILHSVTITPQLGAEQGENHIVQRNTRKSTVVKPDLTVYNGSNDTDSHIGTLYRQNLTPAEEWYRDTDGPTDRFSLLRILAEDNLRISPRPMIRFEGNVYGYMGILSHITIDNVPGNFQISKYSHDIQTNINRATFTEYATGNLSDADYSYEMTFDYGNVKNVKINT